MRYRGEIRPAIRKGSIREFFGGNPTLKANWGFNESELTKVLDTSGNAYHGTVSGTKYPYIGRFGVNFKFINTFVEVSVPLTFATGATILFWVTLPLSFSGHQGLFYVGDYGGYFHYTSPTSITFYFIPDSWPTGYVYTSIYGDIGKLSSLITVTLAGNGNKITMFKNGQYQMNATYTSANKTLTRIGSYYGVPTFAGSLEETAIFSRVLSPAEISQYYRDAISEPRKYWYYSPAVGGVIVPWHLFPQNTLGQGVA